jgi:DNA-directed RNA polymerase specialized sigma24 family protein
MNASTAALEETALLERWRGGDEGAAKQFLARYLQPVFGLVRCVSGCTRNQAYEVTARTFVEALRTARTLAGRGQLMPALLPILLAQLKGTPKAPTLEAPQLAGLRPERQTLLEVMKQALLGLPDDERCTLLLRDQLHLPYDEIGQATNRSAKEARAMTLRSRSQLRDRLKEALAQRRS